jgi:hypothetical protein
VLEGGGLLEVTPGGACEVADVDCPPVQDGPAEDCTAVDLESLAEPPHSAQPAVLGHEAEAVSFGLKDQRVAGLAEAGGGAGDRGENGSGTG